MKKNVSTKGYASGFEESLKCIVHDKMFTFKGGRAIDKN